MDRQYKLMTETPISRLIPKLALPAVVSMLISSIYNLVDSFFVGQIGTSASGAVGIVLVIQSIIQACGFTFGHGAGSIISRKLGERDTDSATIFASTSFFLSILAGTLIAVFGLIFLNPLLRLLGSTETILPYARQYGIYILIAAPFMASSCVLNNIMRYEGKAALAMIGLSVGGILNMIGDPIFMFTLDMGVAGAGLSTALSQFISFLILLIMFLAGHTQSKISLRRLTHSFKDIGNIVTTGTPSLIRQGLNSISSSMLNNAAGVFGDPAIAAMSIVGRISMFVGSIMIGIGQGLQPAAAFNFGAKKYSRVKKSFMFTLFSGELLLAVFAVIVFFISPYVIQLFRDDPEVVKIGITALRFQCVAMILMPLSVCINMTFQSIGAKKKASFVSLLRSGIYLLPAIAVLPRVIGLLGVQSAQAVADVFTFITVLPMAVSFIRNIPKDEKLPEAPSN